MKSFRSRSQTSGLQEGLTEVVLPDRFHSNQPELGELIFIGNEVYANYFKRGWTKLPKGSSQLVSLFTAELLFDNTIRDMRDVVVIGTETLDGVETIVYKYTLTLPPEVSLPTQFPRSSKHKLWIARSDQLPRKLESVSAFGVKNTTTYFDYNADIQINPPIP